MKRTQPFHNKGASTWIGLAFTAAYGALGILPSFVGYRVFDLVETKIDFADEIKKGNVAAAGVIGSFLLGICYNHWACDWKLIGRRNPTRPLLMRQNLKALRRRPNIGSSPATSARTTTVTSAGPLCVTY